MRSLQIVILGGGYSGVLATRRLAHKVRKQRVEITLINESAYFRERVRSHQLAANQRLPNVPLCDLLSDVGARFLQGRVVRLIPERRLFTVQTNDGPELLHYDYLIYALGSFVDTSSVPGVADHTFSVNTQETTLELRQELSRASSRGRHLVVCGGGLGGIEIATEFAETYPDLGITLITRGKFGTDLSRRGQSYLRRAFDSRGIQVLEQATICGIEAGYVEYQGGKVKYDLCVWAGGFAISSLARQAGLAVNSLGQIIVDNHLRSISRPEIHAVGDSASVSDAIGTSIRMACATALPLGAYAADDLAALIQGEACRPYEYGYMLRCISLGRRDALIQLVDADDKPKERIITGWLGARIKESLCRYALWQVYNDRWMYYPRRPLFEPKEKRENSVSGLLN